MIKVLHKAFDLLESMSADKKRVYTLTELAAMIHEKPTTCANIVKTLCDRGYISRAEPKGYTLGVLAQGINYVDASDVRLVEISREPMKALSDKYGASGVLAVLRRGRKKILDSYSGESDFVINKTVREDHELYTTSTGIVLTSLSKLSFSDDETETIKCIYGSAEKFDEIRRSVTQNGYLAITIRPRIFEVAAPIYKNGEIYAAIAVYLPEFLVEDDEKSQLIKEICEISKNFGERI